MWMNMLAWVKSIFRFLYNKTN